MGCCCKEDETEMKAGIVGKRSCRDVLFLLAFIGFWVGMFVVCGISFEKGDLNRLVYGLDSTGFLCGTKNQYQGTTLDFTDRKNLYYLNPLELLDKNNIPYAKSICVDSCPGFSEVCKLQDAAALKCNETNTRCPYYRMAERSLYGRISGVNAADTEYFYELSNTTVANDPSVTALLNSIASKGEPFRSAILSMVGSFSAPSISGKYYQATSQFPGQGPCYPVWVETKAYFTRCFPKFSANMTSSLVSSAMTAIKGEAIDQYQEFFNKASEKWTRMVGDISKGILIICVAGLAGGIVFSLVWMVILRYFAGLMAYGTIVLVNLTLVGCTLYSCNKAGLLGKAGAVGGYMEDYMSSAGMDPTGDNRKDWEKISYAAIAVTCFIFVLTLLMISRIIIAVKCIKVASQAVAAMPMILFFPLLPFIFEVGLVIYWVSVTAMLYSSGDLTPHFRNPNATESYTFGTMNLTAVSSGNVFGSSSPSLDVAYDPYPNMTLANKTELCRTDENCYLTYEWDNNLKYCFIYHFFGLLWTNQFIVGFSCVTIAGAIGQFYWAGGDRSQMNKFPVLTALKNTVVYHMGSIAFGAFIIAVIQFIRAMLAYLQRKTKQYQEKCAPIKWIFCCVQCCLWCLEKIVQFINRNAYILIAIKGKGYCASACKAIALIVTNALRLAVVNVIGDLVIVLGKLAVASGCGLVAFGLSELPYYTDNVKHPDTYLASPVLPIALAILIGFVVAEVFFSVYDMAIDTIILSYCEDCNMHDDHPKCAPPLLQDMFTKQDKKRKAAAEATAKDTPQQAMTS